MLTCLILISELYNFNSHKPSFTGNGIYVQFRLFLSGNLFTVYAGNPEKNLPTDLYKLGETSKNGFTDIKLKKYSAVTCSVV